MAATTYVEVEKPVKADPLATEEVVLVMGVPQGPYQNYTEDGVNNAPLYGDQFQAANPNGREPLPLDLVTGLFDCFNHGELCANAWCLSYCQAARQLNLLKGKTPSWYSNECLAAVVVDAAINAAWLIDPHLFVLRTFSAVGLLTYYTRFHLRVRMGLAPAYWVDAFSSICCHPCTIGQNQIEMERRGRYVGTACTSPHASANMM